MVESLERRIAQISNGTEITLEGQRFRAVGMTRESARRVSFDQSGVRNRGEFNPDTNNLITLQGIDDPSKTAYQSIGELARHIRNGIASVEGIQQ